MNEEYKGNKMMIVITLTIVFAIFASIIFVLVNSLLIQPAIKDAKSKEQVIEYLNTKYGNGNWQIVAGEKLELKSYYGFVADYSDYGHRYTVSSSYLGDNKFNVRADEFGVKEDGFLPTYYSIKYNLKYTLSTYTKGESHALIDDFSEFFKKVKYVVDYHYPNTKTSENKIREAFKIENITDYHRIPSLEEIISFVEEKLYMSGEKNEDKNDQELIRLVFEEKVVEIDNKRK